MCKNLALFGYAALIVAALSQSVESKLARAQLPSPTYYRTHEGCICLEIYAPVCATDGRTYGNSCELKCTQQHNPYLLGVCKGECPCCKEPYQNDPYPVDFPEIGGGGGGGEGWGWNTMGSTWGRWGLGSAGMSFPYWNRGYTASASYPVSVSAPEGKGSYIQIVASKSSKMDKAGAEAPEAPASQKTVIVSAEAKPPVKEILHEMEPLSNNEVSVETASKTMPSIQIQPPAVPPPPPKKEEEFVEFNSPEHEDQIAME